MVDFNIKIAKDDDIKLWDGFVDLCSTGSLFHKTSWLETAADETKTDLIRLLCFKDHNLLVALPVFIKKFMGFRFAFSPPPKCLIPAMGLVIATEKMRQDGFERKYFKAVDSIENFIKHRLRVDYIRIVNSVELNDVRPFIWNNYTAHPNYTYFITLHKDETMLYENMKRQVRTDIRRAKKYNDLQLFNGDRKTYFELIQLVRDRYSEQKLYLPVSDTYAGKIFDELNQKSQLIIKAIRNDKQILTGLILLKYKNKIQHWIGGIVPKEKYIGINELLHWTVIKENIDKDILYYDLVGANTKQLCRSKSKFNPELRSYLTVERGNLKGKLLKYCYSKFIN